MRPRPVDLLKAAHFCLTSDEVAFIVDRLAAVQPRNLLTFLAREGSGHRDPRIVQALRLSIGVQNWFWRIFGATSRGLILHIGTHFRRLPMWSVERRGILPKGLKTVRVELAGNRVLVHACARSAEAACPRCGQLSRRVHSCYRRHLADTLAHGREVRIVLTVRHFRGFVQLTGLTPKSQQIFDGGSTQFQ